jgi:hypothetical protein
MGMIPYAAQMGSQILGKGGIAVRTLAGCHPLIHTSDPRAHYRGAVPCGFPPPVSASSSFCATSPCRSGRYCFHTPLHIEQTYARWSVTRYP